MGVKEFLEPSKGKILISLSLLMVSILLIIWLFFPLLFSQSLRPFLRPFDYFRYTLFLGLSLIFFIPLAYFLGCCINKGKKWRWVFGIIIYFFIALVVIPEGLIYALDEVSSAYNRKFSHSCTVDSDCFPTCGLNAVNNKSISLAPRSPFVVYKHSSCLVGIAICENNLCDIYSEEKASVEYCERRTHDRVKSICYEDLARKIEVEAKRLNDISICNKIEDEEHRKDCKREVEEG
ncbi:MAG: hypothetical protein Q8O30_01350 [Candidatus Omnitrophota bacterium]|nr:hypothetical protein [Candidatus Omnitrophota bacterium]